MRYFKSNVESVKVLHFIFSKLPSDFTQADITNEAFHNHATTLVELAHISVVETNEDDSNIGVIEPTDTGIVDLTDEGFHGYPMWNGYKDLSCTKCAKVPEFSIMSLVAPVLSGSDYAQIVKLDFNGESIWVSDTSSYNPYSVVINECDRHVRIVNATLEGWLVSDKVQETFVATYANPKRSLLESCDHSQYVIEDTSAYASMKQSFLDAHYDKAVDLATDKAQIAFFGEIVDNSVLCALTKKEEKQYMRILNAIVAVEKFRMPSKKDLSRMFDSSPSMMDTFRGFDTLIDVLIVK